MPDSWRCRCAGHVYPGLQRRGCVGEIGAVGARGASLLDGPGVLGQGLDQEFLGGTYGHVLATEAVEGAETVFLFMFGDDYGLSGENRVWWRSFGRLSFPRESTVPCAARFRDLL